MHPGRIRYRVITDPRNPDRFRVQNVINKNLVGISFATRAQAQRGADRRNRPWRQESRW